LDNGVHVGHNTCIGQNCLLAARVVLSGNVTIKDDVYIGPSSTISNRVTINQEARVSIGSTVVQDVLPQEEVSGHFAIPHKLYLKQKAWLKKITKGRKS
jgi:UDP-3-O-[3-hydroxymyristoyl] glucosamine N-acyltransferase